MFISRDFASTKFLLLSLPASHRVGFSAKGQKEHSVALRPFSSPNSDLSVPLGPMQPFPCTFKSRTHALCLHSHAWFSSFCELVCKILGVQHPLVFYRLILVLQTLHKREPASKHVREGCEMPCWEEE